MAVLAGVQRLTAASATVVRVLETATAAAAVVAAGTAADGGTIDSGGGGSSYIGGVLNGVTTSGVNEGHGRIETDCRISRGSLLQGLSLLWFGG